MYYRSFEKYVIKSNKYLSSPSRIQKMHPSGNRHNLVVGRGNRVHFYRFIVYSNITFQTCTIDRVQKKILVFSIFFLDMMAIGAITTIHYFNQIQC